MPDNVPQFGVAEYPSAPGTDICKSCNQPAVGSYYRVNGAVACERCKEQLEAQLPKDGRPRSKASIRRSRIGEPGTRSDSCPATGKAQDGLGRCIGWAGCAWLGFAVS